MSDDWRASLTQSYRSTMIKNVASVLASLDGSNPAAKMVMAMEFEEQMFTKGKNRADYEKRINKRMERMRKSYRPPPADTSVARGPSPTAGAGPAAAAASNGTASASDGRTITENDIISRHGEALRYIARYGAKAVRVEQSRAASVVGTNGANGGTSTRNQQAERLRANINLVLRHAVDVGIDVLAEGRAASADDRRQARDRATRRKRAKAVHEATIVAYGGTVKKRKVAGKESENEDADIAEGEVDEESDKYRSAELFNLPELGKYRRTPQQLLEINSRLAERVENVLDHVQKRVDLHDFMGGKVDLWSNNGGGVFTQTVSEAFDNKRIETNNISIKQNGTSLASPSENMKAIRSFLDRATASLSLFPEDIPPKEEDNDEVDVAKTISIGEENFVLASLHADRVLAASELITHILSLRDAASRKKCHDEKMIKRARTAAQVSTKYLEDIYCVDFSAAAALKKSSEIEESDGVVKRKDLTLEDIWKNPLQYAGDSNDADDIQTVLMTANIKSAGVISNSIFPLPQSHPLSIQSQVLLSPGRPISRMLLRQLPPNGLQIIHPLGKSPVGGGAVQIVYSNILVLTAYLYPLLVTIQPTGDKVATKEKDGNWAYDGLHNFHHDTVCGSLSRWGRPFPTVSASSTANLIQSTAVRNQMTVEMVRKKLDYSSAQATYVLRRCFGEVMSQAVGRSDPEVEIIEITALLNFLRIVEAKYGYGY